MKRSSMLLWAVCLLMSFAHGQTPRPDVYHVHFAIAAPGKAAALGEYLKSSSPAGHSLVLRHQDGAEWDYCVIEHLGTSATITAAGNPPPANARDLSATHTDTFVNGPAWADFVKAMGLGDNASKTSSSVYVVSYWRPVAGHREQLEKALSATPPGQSTNDAVLLQHLEGAAWTYLAIVRYNSWADFGKSEADSVAQTNKGGGGWYDVREHGSYHTDTITDRIAP